MKQKLLNKFWLRVGMIVAVMTTALAGTAWAETVVDVLNQQWTGVTGTTYSNWTNKTATSSAVYAGNCAGGNNSIQLRSDKSNSGIVTTTSGGKVKKVTVEWNAATATDRVLDIYGKNTAYTNATDLYNNSNQGTKLGSITFDGKQGTGEVTVSNDYEYIGLRSSSGAMYLKSITITWETGGSTAPSISADDVDVAYNATSGSISYTLTNEVTGGSMTAATTSDWLTVGTVANGSVPFTCSTNTTKVARTATVTLTYTYNTSETVTKNVTVTQAGNPNIVDNISDITAAGTYTVQGTIVAKSQRGFIVGDGTGYVYYYNTSYSQTDYNIGDKVKLSGAVSAYGGVLEYSSSATVTSATESNYVEEEPTVLSGSDMDTRVASTTPAQLSSYVQYEGTLSVSGTYYNITNISGATTAKGSISFPISTDFTSLAGKTVKVKGYYVGISSSQYYNTMIGSIEEVVNAVPVITASDVNIAYDATSGEIAYTIANPVSGVTLSATTNADWISNITVGASSVTFTTTANEGNADRTATITLSYTGAESKVVTVTQGHYVADFATLPFEFDGGRDDIAGTDGLTQSGLGTDYNATTNPTTKLKFDTTGDELILAFSERPGVLTFDIKGNGFSGGTFTVQTSVDGTTYTDLATYTALDTQSEEFNNLGESVRYIKWIYTNKVSGNVGLGNINLAEYAEPVLVASITVDPADVNVNADEHDGTLDLTYENLTISDMTDFGVQYYTATGEEATEPDWLDVVVAEQDPSIGDGYVVSYYMIENEGSDARTAYFKVFAMGDEDFVYSNLVTVTQAAASVTPPTPAGSKYVKVTSTADLTDGQYLIVYEEGGVAFDGSLETLDAVSNTIEVDINSGEIAATSATTAAEFTIQETEDGYSIESASGLYIGQTSDANGLKADASTVYANAITFSDNNANIVSGGAYLRYNANSGQTRFRYFKSSTYTNQKAIQLYKFVEATPEPYAPETITLNASGYATFASTSAVDFTNAETNGYSAWQVTGVDASGVITCVQITGAVAAGTGVLLKGTASTQVTIAYTTSGATLSDNKLVGFTAATKINSNKYFGLSGAKFVKVNGGIVPAGKALLPASVVNGTGVKTLTFNFDEDATAIKAIDNGQLTTDGVIYNVAGQRLSKMQKGINIVNGRKVLY